MIYKTLFSLLLIFGLFTILIGDDKYQLKVSKEDVIKAGNILASKGGFTAVVRKKWRGHAVIFTIEPNKEEGTLSVGEKLKGQLQRSDFFKVLIKNKDTGLYELNLNYEEVLEVEELGNPVSALLEKANIDVSGLVDKQGIQLGSRMEEYAPINLVEFDKVVIACEQKPGTKFSEKLACSHKADNNTTLVATNYEAVQNIRLAALSKEAASAAHERGVAAHERGVENQAEIAADLKVISDAKKSTAFHKREAEAVQKLIDQD